MPAPTIVTFGDSITARREGYIVFTDMLSQAFAERCIEAVFINAGIGGNTTRDAMARFASDVLAHRPQVVTIMLGTNDAAVDVWKDISEPRVPVAEYAANLAHFIETLHAIDATVILMLPPPACWSDVLREHYNKPPYDVSDPESWQHTTRSHRAAARQVAARHAVPCMDHQQTFRQAAAAGGIALSDLLPDGMHPNTAGHRVITDALLPELLRALG